MLSIVTLPLRICKFCWVELNLGVLFFNLNLCSNKNNLNFLRRIYCTAVIYDSMAFDQEISKKPGFGQ